MKKPRRRPITIGIVMLMLLTALLSLLPATALAAGEVEAKIEMINAHTALPIADRGYVALYRGIVMDASPSEGENCQQFHRQNDKD